MAAHRQARGLGKAAPACRAHAQPQGPARSLCRPGVQDDGQGLDLAKESRGTMPASLSPPCSVRGQEGSKTELQRGNCPPALKGVDRRRAAGVRVARY